jgi:hypothetical protein
MSSASAAALGNSIDCAMSRKPFRKRLENAFGGPVPQFSEEPSFEYRLGCCLDAE